eukprot:gene2957-3529_t
MAGFRLPRVLLATASGPAAAGAGGWYATQLATRPLLTKAVTSAAIGGACDMFCQLAIQRDRAYSAARTARMALLGGAMIGPALHFWYNLLNSAIPGATAANAIQRLLLDQLVFAPIFCASFFAALFTLEGRPGQLPAHLRENYCKVVLANWQLWVPAQFINFYAVPPLYQVLFANMVALVWNTYLNWTGHQDKPEKPEKADC